LEEDHTPTSTMIRFPVVIAVGRVTVRVAVPWPCVVTLWTNCGCVALGVTEFEAEDGAPVPTELVAVTVNV
jgi:hypothetical protein